MQYCTKKLKKVRKRERDQKRYFHSIYINKTIKPANLIMGEKKTHYCNLTGSLQLFDKESNQSSRCIMQRIIRSNGSTTTCLNQLWCCIWTVIIKTYTYYIRFCDNTPNVFDMQPRRLSFLMWEHTQQFLCATRGIVELTPLLEQWLVLVLVLLTWNNIINQRGMHAIAIMRDVQLYSAWFFSLPSPCRGILENEVRLRFLCIYVRQNIQK